MESEQETPIPENTPNDSDIPENNNASSPHSYQIKAVEDPPEIKQGRSSPSATDLEKLSAEIDPFISSLLSSQGEESDPPDVPVSIEQFLVLVEDKIGNQDSGVSSVKWSQFTDEDSDSFLGAVNRVASLSKALSKFSSVYQYAYSINRTGIVLQRAMSYLEEEFKSLLEDYKVYDPDPTTEEVELGYSDEVLSKLTKLASAMIDGAYETECCEVYYVVRRNAMEDSLQKIGFEKNSADDVHKMSWEALEKEIETRIKKFKKFAESYFPAERKLSDHIFTGHPSVSESLFLGLSSAVAVQFLNFAEAVALTKRSAEKLFKFLDTYEAVREVMAKVESLSTGGESIELKNEATMIKTNLGEAVIVIFNELNSSIRADSIKNPVPGGAVHPLTKHIMDYLESVSFYLPLLEQVFMEIQKSESESDESSLDNPESGKQSPSPFQAQLLKIMDLLDANIEAKSKLYKDSSLSSIFMMNNGRFMLKKIKRCNELNNLLGEAWYRKKSSDLRQYHKGYQRDTWGKLLSCLNPEGLTVNGKVVKPTLKERFKSFNAMFDDIRKTQSNWVIADEQMQSELRVSISNMVVPAYRSFLARYSQVFSPGRQTEKYVKLQPEELETTIDGLFSGAPTGKKK